MDNARTQILDCYPHFRQFPSAKIAQMLETAKLNGNILHVDSLCLTLYCFRITYYFENSFVVSVVVSVIRWEVSVGDSVVVACVSLFTCGKIYLLGHPTLRGWSKRLAPEWQCCHGCILNLISTRNVQILFVSMAFCRQIICLKRISNQSNMKKIILFAIYYMIIKMNVLILVLFN